ncbi:protein TOC75-3, chloroplastic, partial [Tanacetum coccineum]
LLPWNVFNIEAQRQALRNLYSLSLFSNIEVYPLPDEKQEGGILVGIKLKEDKQTKAGGFAKFPIAWRGFLPTLDDLAFKIEYVHPYLDGVSNSQNRTLRTSYSTKRKINHVFTGRLGVGIVPPIYVDQDVIEANITENITNESELTYGIVMEEITTRDKSGNIVLYGQMALPYGGIISDRKAYLQANM